MAKKPQDTWIISGKEAEALHLEEEDFSEREEQSEDDEDPIQKIIQSRYLFSFILYHYIIYLIYQFICQGPSIMLLSVVSDYLKPNPLSFQVGGSQMQQRFTQRVRKERLSGKLEVEGRVRITFPSRRLMTSLGEQREARDW